MMDFFEEKDYLNGDHSFKMWFKIMWKNTYIQTFIAAVALLTLFLIYYPKEGWDFGFFIGLAVPTFVMILIAYKGFYQFWNDLKNGRSR